MEKTYDGVSENLREAIKSLNEGDEVRVRYHTCDFVYAEKRGFVARKTKDDITLHSHWKPETFLKKLSNAFAFPIPYSALSHVEAIDQS